MRNLIANAVALVLSSLTQTITFQELIREYLEYNQLHHSLSVFLAESGQPVERAFERGESVFMLWHGAIFNGALSATFLRYVYCYVEVFPCHRCPTRGLL